MKLTYLLRRQDSNLRPSPYESVMQPSTPRRGLKNPHILTDLEEHSKNEFHQSLFNPFLQNMGKVANERVELPMTDSELAVLPLHYMAIKTAYRRLAVDNILFHFKFIKYERNFLANIKRFIIITRCQTKWTRQIQTCNSNATLGFIN